MRKVNESRVRAAVVCFALGALVSCGVGCEDDAPEVCSTGSTWTEGEDGSPLMQPGGNCIQCHAEEGEGPLFVLAGTVMNAFDDDTNCNGVEGVTVQITGADGQIVELTSNSAGNFFLRASEGSVAKPYTAKLIYEGKERPMGTPQSEGACASCHTPEGANGAPGRIVAPE